MGVFYEQGTPIQRPLSSEKGKNKPVISKLRTWLLHFSTQVLKSLQLLPSPLDSEMRAIIPYADASQRSSLQGFEFRVSDLELRVWGAEAFLSHILAKCCIHIIFLGVGTPEFIPDCFYRGDAPARLRHGDIDVGFLRSLLAQGRHPLEPGCLPPPKIQPNLNINHVRRAWLSRISGFFFGVSNPKKMIWMQLYAKI